ncbi:hypothetical protein GH714_041700 [Hevea brasiliensis]|uniref:Uncharacterized protein n=1 Tax=Hevea brasiliensis TaxID=3981 RepID=A0A6A6MWT1_HEVBR|nr:hypothetical protein GH714_041700 [Hevea brasiliensis]
MNDVVVVHERAVAAVIEIPDTVDLEVLAFDQAVNSKALFEVRVMEEAVGKTVEGQMLPAATAGEIVERQMLLAAQSPCAQSFGFPIVAGLPLAALQVVAEPQRFPASPSKMHPCLHLHVIDDKL